MPSLPGSCPARSAMDAHGRCAQQTRTGAQRFAGVRNRFECKAPQEAYWAAFRFVEMQKGRRPNGHLGALSVFLALVYAASAHPGGGNVRI